MLHQLKEHLGNNIIIWIPHSYNESINTLETSAFVARTPEHIGNVVSHIPSEIPVKGKKVAQ